MTHRVPRVRGCSAPGSTDQRSGRLLEPCSNGFASAFNDRLGILSVALGDPGTDLRAILEVLVDDLSAAVSSFLGLRMTLQPDWCPVTLTAVDPDLAFSAGTSLALPRSLSTRGGAGGIIVFCAGHPGGFVDLERVLGTGGRIVLAGDLPGRSAAGQRRGIGGLAELGVVNRVIGVVITRGHTPAEARAELRRTLAGARGGRATRGARRTPR